MKNSIVSSEELPFPEVRLFIFFFLFRFPTSSQAALSMVLTTPRRLFPLIGGVMPYVHAELLPGFKAKEKKEREKKKKEKAGVATSDDEEQQDSTKY